MQIQAVATQFPEHYYDQATLLRGLRRFFGDRLSDSRRVAQIHRNVAVSGRYLALPIAAYPRLNSFSETNDAYIRCAVDLGGKAIRKALDRCALRPADVDHVAFVTSTGVATPSIEARLHNRLGFRRDVKRLPIFGLGCVAGAAAIARTADYLRAFPSDVAVVLSVELCSLTLQRGDISMANIVASGLFGDGAAAAVMVGAERVADCVAAPRVLASRSIFYPDTEQVMGWQIGESGFRVRLSADVPRVVRTHVRGDVDRFLADNDLSRSKLGNYVCHPGGPKVLEALAEALAVDRSALAQSWKMLAEVGNLSSASVLSILEATLEQPPDPQSHGLLMAMGPAFCSELVLLRW